MNLRHYLSVKLLQEISSSGKIVNSKNMTPKDPIWIYFLFLLMKMEKKNLQDVKGVNCLSVPRVRETKCTAVKIL